MVDAHPLLLDFEHLAILTRVDASATLLALTQFDVVQEDDSVLRRKLSR